MGMKHITKCIIVNIGQTMDSMDMSYDGHAWCTTKTTDIHIEFGLIFWRCSCDGHLECPDDLCKYIARNCVDCN